MSDQSYSSKMQKTVESFKGQLGTIRTGRANPDILSRIQVDYYGSMVPIKQVANITVPESMTLLLNVFDRSAVKSVEKAILTSDLGLNPQTDGSSIRLRFPDLTQERRKDLVKIVKKESEEAKISLRNIRRDAVDSVKSDEKAKHLAEDASKRAQEDIQKQTDHFIKLIDQITQEKESEIMTL